MRQMPSSLRRIAATCVFAAAFCWPLPAATVSKLNDDVLAALRGPVVAKQLHITMPLYAHGTAKIELDEFQVWAPGGKVIVHDGKSVQYLDPPPMRFFRGMVNGDPESFAFFSVDGTTAAIEGMVATRDGKYTVNASRRRPAGSKLGNRGDDFDYYLTASDDTDAIPMTGQTWTCETDKLRVLTPANKRILTATDLSGHVIAQGITGTQAYAMAIEVETDYELYVNAGNDVNLVSTLVANLTGAVSTIYNRDIHTNVVLQNLHTYTAGAGIDPWAATNASAGLYELSGYYHNNQLSLKRSAVVMLSGKATQSGVAFLGTIGLGDIGTPDNLTGPNWFGSYAWCGSIGNLQGAFTTTVPDPNATTNGTLYGMPTGGNNYWPLEEYAHELGHNLAGHHTHCVAITSGEAAGTNHPSQLFVDMCFTGEVDTDPQGGPSSACATGTPYSSAPTEKGTIMSYCHNIRVTGVPQSRFTLGQASEVSRHELDDYMLRPAGPLSPYGGLNNIVTAVGTFSMSAITASSSVAANSTGNTASVSAINGNTVTYAWTITGGTITSALDTASIAYTAGASGSVVLRATLYNATGNNFAGFPSGGVAVTDTKTVTINTCTAPAITAQPSPATTMTGQDALLSVGASGTATLSYQWYTGNSGNTSAPIVSGISASVVVSPATTTSYWVRVSNSCGSADSATVTVTVTTNTPSAATTLFLVTPCRIIDTRNANGPQGGPALGSGATRNITVAGVCGIPTGVMAISINVAVVAPTAGGFLTLFTGPSTAPLPLASTINFQTGRTLANNAIVRAGSDTINVYNGGPTVHFVIDVNGYFK